MSRADLEEERDSLLESLRSLEAEHAAGDLSDDDYHELRDTYTSRAATVLRALEEGGDPRDTPQAPEPVRVSRRDRLRKVVAVLLVAGVAATGGLGVALLAGDRQPGQGATGSLPTTVQGLLDRAHQLEAEGEALEAIKAYDAVLDQDPANVEALAYRGWILRLAGVTDAAEQDLSRAVAVDPAYPDARFFRGLLLLRDRSDPAAALADFEVFMAADPPPELAAAVEGLMVEARAMAEDAPEGE